MYVYRSCELRHMALSLNSLFTGLIFGQISVIFQKTWFSDLLPVVIAPREPSGKRASNPRLQAVMEASNWLALCAAEVWTSFQKKIRKKTRKTAVYSVLNRIWSNFRGIFEPQNWFRIYRGIQDQFTVVTSNKETPNKAKSAFFCSKIRW